MSCSNRKIRVLICDDSLLVRQILSSIFEADPLIEVVGKASDPLSARKMIKEFNPDVLTLDIEMPEMDGLSFLEKIMTLRPMPVVMISSLTQKGTAQTVRALELGVCDVVGKPTRDLQTNFKAISQEILAKVKIASYAKVRAPVKLAEVIKEKHAVAPKVGIIVIGASTGGVLALKEILPLLPENSPPVIVVQHMPVAFTKSFAERLNQGSRIEVLESADGMKVEPGNAYIAKGGVHLAIKRAGQGYMLRHLEGDPVSGHKPSVDYTFGSVAQNVTDPVVSVLLTGMGRDGAKGMLTLRKKGAYTIGQSEESCVVYGMPRVAREVGGVITELPLSRIAGEIENRCWPLSS